MPEPAEGLRGTHAAVVELDPLADPVRARAEHDDRTRRRLVAVALLVREVVVRRPRLELARAGVDGEPAGEVAPVADVRLRDAEQRGDARVREPEALRRGDVACREQRRARRRRSRRARRRSTGAGPGSPAARRPPRRRRAPSAAPPGACGRSRAPRRPRASRSRARALFPGNFSKSKRGAFTAT